MRDLELLDIDGSPITDAALPTIASFCRLESLSMWTTNTTDAGSVSHLSKLKGLRYLVVGPGITRSGALKLVEALPQCDVSHADANGILEPLSRRVLPAR
jgi:hypothetical protein